MSPEKVGAVLEYLSQDSQWGISFDCLNELYQKEFLTLTEIEKDGDKLIEAKLTKETIIIDVFG